LKLKVRRVKERNPSKEELTDDPVPSGFNKHVGFGKQHLSFVFEKDNRLSSHSSNYKNLEQYSQKYKSIVEAVSASI